jgi:hypothetical protein
MESLTEERGQGRGIHAFGGARHSCGFVKRNPARTAFPEPN